MRRRDLHRRLNLALGGRVPVSSESGCLWPIRPADKRARRSSGCFPAAYANYMSAILARLAAPRSGYRSRIANTAPRSSPGCATRIRDGLPFDHACYRLLTYPLNGRQGQPTDADAGETDTGAGALAFITPRKASLRNLRRRTARLFLGVHLECAQCQSPLWQVEPRSVLGPGRVFRAD